MHGDGRRWMGVGRSADADSPAAAAQAARTALTGELPKLLMVFAGIDHDGTALLEGLREVAPGVPIIGCSTHGEIGPGGPLACCGGAERLSMGPWCDVGSIGG